MVFLSFLRFGNYSCLHMIYAIARLMRRLEPNPAKPELKIEDLLMSLRSALFKIERIP